MDKGSYGFAWKHNAGVAPVLLAGWRMVRGLRGISMRMKHPVWVLDYAMHECGLVRVASAARQWQPRLARTAHLYPPETAYWEEYPRHADPLTHSAHITFLGGEVCGLAALVHPRARYGRFLDPEGQLGKLIEEVARIGCREEEHGFWQAQAVFCTLIDLLLDSKPVEKETRSVKGVIPTVSAASDLVLAANTYLDEHLSEIITLPALAQHLRVSVSTLSHRYGRETGESPMSRLIRMRINLAKALITKGQPLKIVAESTGFSDAFHLSKTFKRIEGLSPKAYLQSLRNIAGQRKTNTPQS